MEDMKKILYIMIMGICLIGYSFVFATGDDDLNEENLGVEERMLKDDDLLNEEKLGLEDRMFKDPCECSTGTSLTCRKGDVISSSYDSEAKTTTRVCWWTSCYSQITCTLKDTEYAPAKQTLWIGLSPECLVHGGCSLDVYKTLWIRENSPKETRTSVLSLFQDAIGAATFFIGTIVTIAFVWAWFKFVLAGRNGDSSGRSSAQQGMIYAIIGLILVMSSYAIIRLVQYIASTQ